MRHLLNFNVLIFTGRNEVVAKVMFLHVCVILFTGGGGLRADPPWTRQTPLPPGPGRPPHPPRTRQTPLPSPPKDQAEPPPPPQPGRHPPDQADPPQTRQTPPDQADTPPPRREEDCSIRSMSGRYASYWNAFLLYH